MTKKEQLRRRIIELTDRENINSFVITNTLNKLGNGKQYWLKDDFIISLLREKEIKDGMEIPKIIEERVCQYEESGEMINTLDDQSEETIEALHQLLITE